MHYDVSTGVQRHDGIRLVLEPDRREPAPLDGAFSLASDIIELIVLTDDERLLDMLRTAVGRVRRVWQAASADSVGDLLVAGAVGILVLDAAMLSAQAATFIVDIKRQFPELVILLAGDRDMEVALAALISAGTIYRFIHKPVSPGRAKLFVDAAVKKYNDHRAGGGARRDLGRTSSKRRSWLVGASAGLAVIVMTAAFIEKKNAPTDQSAGNRNLHGNSSEPQSPLLSRAATALAENRLTAPGGDNALEFYRLALRRDPLNKIAHAGLAEVHERLVGTAEDALFTGRLDAAATAIEQARMAGVDRPRIALLVAELAKVRAQIKALRAPAPPTANSVNPE